MKLDIGVAVVGAGFIGPVHVEALRRVGVRVLGICGVDADESRQAAERLGLPEGYASFDEVLADANVQSVHLAVPNVLHYAMAKQALEAGKHVMCEKPLAMHSGQSAELATLARERGLAAGVCYNVRFYPLNLHARAMVSSGQVGDVKAVNGSYVQGWLMYDTDYNWRVLASEGGELRAVADIGTHWMDLVRSITGLEVSAVLADLLTVHTTRRRPKGEVETFTGKLTAQGETEPIEVVTDDYGAVLFRFTNGAKGSLYVSQVTAGRKNCISYEIAGSKCALSWNSETPNELWVGYRDKPNELLLRDPALVADSARPAVAYPGGHTEGYPDTFKQCFRAFYEAIASGAPAEKRSYPTFEDGHREIVLCEAILESHKSERWVAVR